MREERGRVTENVTVDELYTLWGSITGDVKVVEGGKMYVRGNIYGDLIIEFGGRVHIYGQISGNLMMFRGSKVINSGIIQGNATNDGGRLYIDRDGSVLGKVKTLRGETTVEPKIDMPGDE